jgi:hypothetical protein
MEIWDAGDLLAFAAQVYNGDPNLEGVLMDDIDLTGVAWTPIGPDADHPFTGSFTGFDGDAYHSITIASFSNSTLAMQYVGLFGYVTGTISDLIVNSANVSQTGQGVDGIQYIGAVAGYAGNDAIFERITLSGSFDFSSYSKTYIGGIAGYSESATFRYNNSTMAISGDSAQNYVYLGGFVGYGSGATISNNQTSGTVVVNPGTVNSSVGGAVGYIIKSTVQNCTATGTVTLSATEGHFSMAYAGGLVGYAGADGLIFKSNASGAVAAYSDFPYVGGLVGYNYSGNTTSQCYATGAVSAITISNENATYCPYAGGLAGYNSGIVSTIVDCYATGTVLASSVGGNTAWAGGITGCNANGALVERCYSTSNVTALIGVDYTPLPSPVNKGAIAGGIAGYEWQANPNIQNSAALNGIITGSPGASSATDFKLHRVLGSADATGTTKNNVGSVATQFYPPYTPTSNADGLDGATVADPPAKSVFEDTLYWEFGKTGDAVWKMNTPPVYPVLNWQT